MHQEFAVDPALIAEWSHPANFRYFVEAFAPDAGRLVSRFPKHWRTMAEPPISALSPHDKLRAAELVKRLGTLMVRRTGYAWRSAPWVENAVDEHRLRPFRAILATSNPRGHPDVLIGDQIQPAEPHWTVDRACVIPQTAVEIGRCARLLIAASSDLLLIDPYFEPQAPRWRSVLKTLLSFLVRKGERPLSCRYHVRVDDRTLSEFSVDCDRFVAREIPRDMDFRIVRWSKLPGGDKQHARYILTERGGIAVDGGLDEQAHATTDVRILEEPIWRRRWEEYRDGGASPFRLADEWPPRRPTPS